MKKIKNILLIIVNFLTFLYMFDIIYPLKLQAAITEIKVTSLANELKLMELKKINETAMLLQNKEILSTNTVEEASSFLTANTLYTAAFVGSIACLMYFCYYSISTVVVGISNSGFYKLGCKINYGVGYLADSLEFKEVTPSPVNIEVLERNLPNILEYSSSTATTSGVPLNDLIQDAEWIANVINDVFA